jgi:predicted metal-binding protein
MVVFCAVGVTLFTENVRTVQIIGLLACGAIIGASLTNIIVTLKSKNKKK